MSMARRPPGVPVNFDALPKSTVDIVGPPMISGEVKLSDGTILKVMLVIPAVHRIENLTDPAGRPMYVIESMTVLNVKHWEKREKGDATQ